MRGEREGSVTDGADEERDVLGEECRHGLSVSLRAKYKAKTARIRGIENG